MREQIVTAMQKVLTRPSSFNADGSVYWNSVDADCVDLVFSDTPFDKCDFNTFYDHFDSVCDQLDPTA